MNKYRIYYFNRDLYHPERYRKESDLVVELGMNELPNSHTHVLNVETLVIDDVYRLLNIFGFSLIPSDQEAHLLRMLRREHYKPDHMRKVHHTSMSVMDVIEDIHDGNFYIVSLHDLKEMGNRSSLSEANQSFGLPDKPLLHEYIESDFQLSDIVSDIKYMFPEFELSKMVAEFPSECLETKFKGWNTNFFAGLAYYLILNGMDIYQALESMPFSFQSDFNMDEYSKYWMSTSMDYDLEVRK